MKVFYLIASVLVLSSSLCVANPLVDSALPGDGEMIGVIKFEGGYQRDLIANVTTKAIVKYFRVDVPAFCGGVEILDAATISEGVKDSAKALPGNSTVFQVANGSGMRIGAVILSLNGPQTAKCSIPIFARNEGQDGPVSGGQEVVNKKVRFCNGQRRRVHFALTYAVGDDWITEGWYHLGRGECTYAKTANAFQDVVYSYAYSDGLITKQWGTQKNFCIGTTSPFLVTSTDCLNGVGGTQWQLFSAHPLSDKGVLTVTYR